MLAGETLAVYRDGTKIGTATMSGTSWTFNDSNLGVGSHSYYAQVENTAGHGLASTTFTITESTPGALTGSYFVNTTGGLQGGVTYLYGFVCISPDSFNGISYIDATWSLSGTAGATYDVQGASYVPALIALHPNESVVITAHLTSGQTYTIFAGTYATLVAMRLINGITANYNFDGTSTLTTPVKATMVSSVANVDHSADASSHVSAAADDSAQASKVVADLSTGPTTQHTVVEDHQIFKGTTGHDTVDLNVDPTVYFKEATAHIEGNTVHPVDATGATVAVNTLHLTGDHQILDLTSLTGQTAAAKISGIEAIDLGGQHNTLKLSLVDVLNLGETDLFQKDGNKQMMVNGKEGDEVDLSNSHVAGLADGEWQQHGTADVGGVTYNVYEHAGAHTELLVQQGVQVVVH